MIISKNWYSIDFIMSIYWPTLVKKNCVIYVERLSGISLTVDKKNSFPLVWTVKKNVKEEQNKDYWYHATTTTWKNVDLHFGVSTVIGFFHWKHFGFSRKIKLLQNPVNSNNKRLIQLSIRTEKNNMNKRTL